MPVSCTRTCCATLLSLAGTGLFRAKWTGRIHAEWVAAVRADRPDIPPERLAVAAMEVVPPGRGWEAVVTTHAALEPEPRMDTHENARTTRHSRMLMVQRLASGWSVAAVAAAQGVITRTVRKWRDRHAAYGEAGLVDCSSRPHHSPARLAPEVEAEIDALRRQLRVVCLKRAGKERRRRGSLHSVDMMNRFDHAEGQRFFTSSGVHDQASLKFVRLGRCVGAQKHVRVSVCR